MKIKVAEHTPGPWKLADPTLEGCRLIIACDEIGSISICDTVGLSNDLMDAANARLIAASPEMLSALQAFQKYFGGKNRDTDVVMLTIAEDPSTMQEVQEKAEAAIQKYQET